MERLLPENVNAFYERFAKCCDSLICDIEIGYKAGVANDFIKIVVSTQDYQSGNEDKWVNILLQVEGVSEFRLIHEYNTCFELIVDGLHIGFFDDRIYIDLSPYSSESSSLEDFRKSYFLVAGAKAFWFLLPYAE